MYNVQNVELMPIHQQHCNLFTICLLMYVLLLNWECIKSLPGDGLLAFRLTSPFGRGLHMPVNLYIHICIIHISTVV
jgi:hypothetical protein